MLYFGIWGRCIVRLRLFCWYFQAIFDIASIIVRCGISGNMAWKVNCSPLCAHVTERSQILETLRYKGSQHWDTSYLRDFISLHNDKLRQIKRLTDITYAVPFKIYMKSTPKCTVCPFIMVSDKSQIYPYNRLDFRSSYRYLVLSSVLEVGHIPLWIRWLWWTKQTASHSIEMNTRWLSCWGWLAHRQMNRKCGECTMIQYEVVESCFKHRHLYMKLFQQMLKVGIPTLTSLSALNAEMRNAFL